MARLNEKDRELVEIKNPVDLSSQKYRYLGGEFLVVLFMYLLKFK